MTEGKKDLVIVTGASGLIGRRLSNYLEQDFDVRRMDRDEDEQGGIIPADLTDAEGTRRAIAQIMEGEDRPIASVIHLAAFYQFSDEEHPLYEKLNVEGTASLLEALQPHRVEQFLYASTMLVHAPTEPGIPIDESWPLEPKWPYPQSKLAAERAIAEHRGHIPSAILRFAGLYTDWAESPTLAHQVQRIFEDQITGKVYAGDTHAGQSAIFIDDCLESVRLTIQKRAELDEEFVALVGERRPMSYQALQNAIGKHLKGEPQSTISVPKPAAKLGAWLQTKAEPVIPDAIDHGEEPFIQPFMIDMAEDHYELDTSQAERALGFRCEQSLARKLPEILNNLLEDPAQWYERNKLTPPQWLDNLITTEENPETALREDQERMERTHRQFMWAHMLNIGMGAWLMVSPLISGYMETPTGISSTATGLAVILFASFSCSARHSWARWVTATLGLWAAFAPLLFWSESAAAYLDGTLAGGIIAGLALLARPAPGVSPAARMDRSALPEGWDYCPSAWEQRIPIIGLAFIGLFISRYLGAYQLEQIPMAWDPFFGDGTERIITSDVSKAWPVPDAGLGGFVYLLEILTGMMGSQRRWRTMPWLVLLFGMLIVPLGAVSLYFIIIQPIVIGTWCTLCLVAASAMLLQIPYSFDEIIATLQFMKQRINAGDSWLMVLLRGGPSDPETRSERMVSDRLPRRWALVMWKTGLSFHWPLWASVVIGALLMATRLLIGSEPPIAHAEHLIGALVITVSIAAMAEVVRSLRFVNVLLGTALIGVPFLFEGADLMNTIVAILAGAILIAINIPRGPVEGDYGSWNRYII